MTAPYTNQQQQADPYRTFSTMQTSGIARPPSQTSYFSGGSQTGGTMPSTQQSYHLPYDTTQYRTGGATPTSAPPPVSMYGSTPPSTIGGMVGALGAAGHPASPPPPSYGGTQAPNVNQQYGQMWNMANVGYGAPQQQQSNQQVQGYQNPGQFNGAQQSNFQPGGYQGPGQFNAYQGSSYNPGQYQNGGSQMNQFNQGGFGGATDAASFGSIMQGLANPSRYGAANVANAYDVMDRKLTQQGTADSQRINEDMAKRGLYNSSVAGGRLGDLATNLNQQRSDLATNLLTDQAKNYQSDRASAIGQALGYGGQQFGQGLQSNQFNEGLSQNRFNNNLSGMNFGLNQNNQNFNQQSQQYGQNQQEAMNRYNSGLNNANFGLQQNNQNYNQQAGQYGLNQQNAMNQFNSGLAQGNFGLQQTAQNNQAGLNQFGAQQGANQQTYNQLMGVLGGQQGYQQQGFENQLAQQQMNNQMSQQQIDNLLRMYGMT
jgi:hypothetical protein